MRAAIYNPYLDTLGGGERYTVFTALVFQKAGYRVDIQWPEAGIKEKLEERFGVDLSEINFVSDVKRGDGYDLCFWVSDGSIPNLKARKNLLHFQVPFRGVNGNTLINKMKMFRIEKVICNSNFTKKIVDSEYGVESMVLYPPVDVSKFKSQKKENLIIYIGRFSQLVQNKRQDILLSAFKRFYDKGFSDWKLVMAGGTEVGSGELVKKLKKAKSGYPVEIIESPDFKTLRNLYGKAKFFWSAAGYGANETKNPEQVEHFGISLVEAMASKVIPIVYQAGGYKEIVEDKKTGFFWEKRSKLLSLTQKVIEDKKLEKNISSELVSASQPFSYENFEKRLLTIIK